MTRRLFSLVFIAVVFRLAFLIFNDTSINLDDQVLWQVAENHLQGKGYTINGLQTAFHSSFMVFMYEGLQILGISQKAWEWTVIIISLTLFVISVSYFFKLSEKYLPVKWANAATVIYIFYPSILFYVGALNYYENIVMPLMVIGVYKLSKGFSWQVILFAIVSSYLKPSTLFIWSAVFLVCLRPKMALLSVSVLCLFQLPALIKNHHQFGHYFLSTQSGYELLQGHNELARGSWYGGWMIDTSAYYKYVVKHIPDSLNEYEQSKARGKMAINWMLENPVKEIKLTARKIAIYFLPKNFEVLYGHNWWNPVNLFVHLGFIAFLFIGAPDKKLLLVIPLACIALSIIFFVAYRVRFFGEPFMIICAMIFLKSVYVKFNSQ